MAGYVLHKTTDDNYCVCKILNEYKTLEDAKNDLVKLLSNNISEKALLKEYSKKQGNK